MILVDTSMWVEHQQRGNNGHADRRGDGRTALIDSHLLLSM